MERFCQECGNKLEENQIFCPECGTSIQKQDEAKKVTPVAEHAVIPPVQSKAKKPMPLTKKISLALIGILVIGLGTGHYMIQAKTSPQEKTSKFLSALEAGDSVAIMNEIVIPADTEKDDQAFADFLESQDFEAFQSRFYEAVSGVRSDGIARFVADENGYDVLKIEQEKFIGLYPTIEIEAIPIEVKSASTIENAEYHLGDKTIEPKEGETFIGNYLPGTYPSTLTVTNGEVVRKVNQEQMIYGDGEMVIELINERVMVKVNSNDTKATVFMDGKSTGKTVEELSVVGPVSEEDTLSLHVERKNKKGEVEKSSEEAAGAGDMVELSFFSEDEASSTVEEQTEEAASDITEEVFVDFITHFRSAYQNALNSKDFSKVEDYLLEGSIAHKEIVDFIAGIGNDYYLYEFLTDNVIDYEVQEDEAFVTTYEEFDFTNHLDEVTNYKRNKRYKILTNEGSGYKISEINILETQKEN